MLDIHYFISETKAPFTMRPFAKFPLIVVLSFNSLLISCEKETEIEHSSISVELKAKKDKPVKPLSAALDRTAPATDSTAVTPFGENLRSYFRMAALEPEECLPSELTPVLLGHLAELVSDPLAEEYFNLYTQLSSQLAASDNSEQYFGKKGEYSSLVNRRIRELERFWDMPGQLQVNGQHSESLNDREKLAAYYYSLIMDEATWEMAYESADNLLALNAQSPNLPESLFFSLDGFLNFNKTVIIGDGLVQMISETGIDPGITYSAILAHEWAHQIQLDNFEAWYPGQDPNAPEQPVAFMELEADFFAAYFLTHKRGATYNWKRVEEFLNLAFTLGDCTTNSPTHHGTPAQRKRASHLGYELAEEAQKKGHILSPEEVHMAFLISLPEILN